MNRLSWVWELTSWSSRLQENYQSLWRNLWNIPQINIEKPKDVNMISSPEGVKPNQLGQRASSQKFRNWLIVCSLNHGQLAHWQRGKKRGLGNNVLELLVNGIGEETLNFWMCLWEREPSTKLLELSHGTWNGTNMTWEWSTKICRSWRPNSARNYQQVCKLCKT